MNDLDRFTAAYIEAVFFTDTGDDGQPSREADLSGDALADIEADCRSFWRRFGCYVTTDICNEAFGDPITQAGHDFHFTRNGHGVGFWEDEWPECYRDMLTKAAENYGPLDIYEADDGLIYVV